jgi:hypothetical protein
MFCLNPDALCIDQLPTNSSLQIYYNSHLIPSHLPPSSLTIHLFRLIDQMDFNCQNITNSLQSFTLVPEIINDRTRKTKLNFNPHLNGSFYLQLQTKDQEQCITGPKWKTTFVPLLLPLPSLPLPPLPTTPNTTSTFTPNSATTNPDDPALSTTFLTRNIWIIVGSSFFVLLIIGTILYTIQKKRISLSSLEDARGDDGHEGDKSLNRNQSSMYLPSPPAYPPHIDLMNSQRGIDAQRTLPHQTDIGIATPVHSHFIQNRLDEVCPDDSISLHSMFEYQDSVPGSLFQRRLSMVKSNRTESFSSVESVEKFMVDFRHSSTHRL